MSVEFPARTGPEPSPSNGNPRAATTGNGPEPIAREAPPPGTILAAGILVATALAYAGFVIPAVRERFLPGALGGSVPVLLWGSHVLEALLHAGMLACGIALLFRRMRWVSGAMALIVANGILFLGRAALFHDGQSVQEIGVVETLVWLTLIPLAPLVWVWLVMRRRRSRPAVPMASWRKWGLASEGIVAVFIIGANVYLAATFARAMMEVNGESTEAAETDEARRATGVPASDAEDGGVPGARSSPGSSIGGPPGAEGGAAGQASAADDESGAGGESGQPGDEPGDEDTALAGGARGSRSELEAARRFLGPLESTEGKRRAPWVKGPSATLVSFWASWCGPCRYELPLLEELQQQLAPRGFQVVLVNVDLESPQQVRQFLQRSGVHLPSLLDREQALFESLGGHALPTAFLLDDRGRPVKGYTGVANPDQLSRDIARVMRNGAAGQQPAGS